MGTSILKPRGIEVEDKLGPATCDGHVKGGQSPRTEALALGSDSIPRWVMSELS